MRGVVQKRRCAGATPDHLLANIFKAIIKYSQKVDLVNEGIVLLCLSKLDLLGILESACLSSIDGNSRRAVFFLDKVKATDISKKHSKFKSNG